MCQVYKIPIHGELILTAGAVHTPQLLMQSGVGDEEEIRAANITPVVNLPAVGKNLQVYKHDLAS
ncbi:hypothetical protein ETH_00031405 [Eimeria tenella]|uniref:Glucose-methanol-choline oxidoreductase N-terminal domain-containing protein n=1 Tax=Eimeria tenella TaxID=5802 RepID=U6L313_EIMTE|nr:hypothetical protein ETH_00031405 [Eimeria tenella]CDJ42984.1 hypothetical protein ETH_00031405 [Eimeria tenella]|eukprot:XP_013233734.1 hypothetical protein ETH_00031405 [Eimeria tenella]